jgi:hypothetical protein
LGEGSFLVKGVSNNNKKKRVPKLEKFLLEINFLLWRCNVLICISQTKKKRYYEGNKSFKIIFYLNKDKDKDGY